MIAPWARAWLIGGTSQNVRKHNIFEQKPSENPENADNTPERLAFELQYFRNCTLSSYLRINLFVQRACVLKVILCYFNIYDNWCVHNSAMTLSRHRVKRSMLLVFWHRQRLVHNIVFHLYFGQNWPTLQRGLCAIAQLLVPFSAVVLTSCWRD